MTNNKNTNPQNEVMVGEGVGFERIRRITGYLAKRAEEKDRVKHNVG